MALDLTTAIAPDLAGRVLASILVSLVSLVSLVNIAMCAGGKVALLAWSRRPTIPVAATRRTLSGDSSTVARRKPSLDDQRGACHRARIIAPQPCIRSVQRVPDHDAVMRIGGEAPGRRAHSRKRCQTMACFGWPPPRIVIGDRRCPIRLVPRAYPARVLPSRCSQDDAASRHL